VLPAPTADLGVGLQRWGRQSEGAFALWFDCMLVQYAAMQTIGNSPGVDQRTLARTIGFDTSTITGVIDRLEARGLVARSASPDDRRVRLPSLTDEGQTLLAEAVPAVLRAQERMLEPLPKSARGEFMRMLRELVMANNELSRAPSE
jgi:DNA-binding MarR family transcriptional regulator